MTNLPIFDVTDGKYLGCFKDHASRPLSGQFTHDPMMTPEQCIEECESMVSGEVF